MKKSHLFAIANVALSIAIIFFLISKKNSAQIEEVESTNAIAVATPTGKIKLDIGKYDPAEFLTSFKTEPVIESGILAGYRITWIKKNSAIEQVGLKVGDIIESLGNQQYSGSPTKNAISMLNSLRKE